MATNRGRCEAHQPKPWAQPSKHTLLINRAKQTEWRKQIKDRAHGLCQHCGKPGSEADHIEEIADGGALYDLSNGQWLCRPCHQARTVARARARRQRAKARVGASPLPTLD